jgi:hypothetical protein
LTFWKTPSNLMSVVLYLYVWGSTFQFHIEDWVQPVHYILIFEDFWTKVGLEVLFKISSIWENFNCICWNLFHFRRTFDNWIYKILHVCYPQWSYIFLGLVLKMPSSQIFLVIFRFQNPLLYFTN